VKCADVSLSSLYVYYSTFSPALRYGHFLIIKIVNFGNDTQRKGIIEELLSHCVKLSSHAEGAKVLDYVYANSTQLEQALIIADFLKGQYALEHKLGMYEVGCVNCVLKRREKGV
jgi:hypothetical protein